MVCSGWLKNDSLCLCLCCSSKCYVASRCNGLVIDIQRPDQEDRLQPWEQRMQHPLVWILSWHCNSERISCSGTYYCHWDITDWTILRKFTATYEEYKETLIVVIDDLTRICYIAKLKGTSSWYRAKSKATLE